MKKLVALSLAGLLTCIPFSALADDTDLEARVAALEERVAALEAQLAGSATAESPAASDSENSITADGFTLTFKKAEVAKDYNDHDCVIVYFDFYNDSNETTSAQFEHLVKVFQNGKEVDQTSMNGQNQATSDWDTDVMPGYGPLEVANAYEINDLSDITVQVTSMSDFSLDPIMFTVPLE